VEWWSGGVVGSGGFRKSLYDFLSQPSSKPVVRQNQGRRGSRPYRG
jgi:hypothetical protein